MHLAYLGIHLQCSGSTNEPEFAFERPDNFPFWDKDSQKKKKKIATSRDAFGYARHLKIATNSQMDRFLIFIKGIGFERSLS